METPKDPIDDQTHDRTHDQTHDQLHDPMLNSTQVPPAHLYYPTSTRLLGAIHINGLRNSSRRFLHLFDDVETATSLAPPLAERVIITVLAGHMMERGYRFWRDENGVWLTESVPAEFLL